MATLITVFSDASFGGDKKGISTPCGSGYWFKSSTTSGSGKASFEAFSVIHAELLGIFHAVQSAVTSHSGEPVDMVIQCDSTGALDSLIKWGGAVCAKTSPIKLSGNRNGNPTTEKKTAKAIRELVGPNAKIWVKHVKGHTNGRKPDGTPCNRSGVNILTDRLAREARKQSSQ